MRRSPGYRRFCTSPLFLLCSCVLVIIFWLNLSFLSRAASSAFWRKDAEVLLPTEPKPPPPPTKEVPRYVPLKHKRSSHSKPSYHYADPSCPFAGPWKYISSSTFDWRSAHPRWNSTPIASSRPQRIYQLKAGYEEPVITIAVPFYNTRFEIFNETVTSVLRQSLQRFELLIINDGSNDSAALQGLQQFRYSRDKRIRVIDHERNRGLPAARNTGFKEAKTPYLFQLDSDDLLERTALEKTLWLLVSHPEFAFSNGFTVGFGVSHFVLNKGFSHPGLFLSQNPITTNHLFRVDAWRKAGGYNETIVGGLEDWDWNLLAMTHELWGWTVAEPVDWYRQRENHFVGRWENFQRKRMLDFQAYLRSKYSALYSQQVMLHSLAWTKPKVEEPFSAPVLDPPFRNLLEKTKPHMLFIIPWLAVGGADLYNSFLTRALVERGWDVTVVTTVCGDHSQYPRFASHTPDVFVMPRFLKLGTRPAFLSYLIESRQPDVVAVTNSELGYEMLPYLVQRHPEPLYIDIGHMEEEYWRSGGYPRYSVGVNSILDHSIVISHHLKDWMVKQGADPEKITAVHIGVDTQKWKRSEEARAHVRGMYNISRDTTVLLFVGRLSSQKNPNVLLTILRRLKEYEQSFFAFIIGDGEQRTWLEKLQQVSNLTQAAVVTGVEEEGVYDFMSASDILLLPSKFEGIALVLYEAMSMGLVPISGAIGGQAELVTPTCNCGMLIDTPHWSLLTDGPPVTALGQRYVGAVIALLGNLTKMHEMGQRAREQVLQSFELSNHPGKVVDVLCRVRQQRAPRNFTMPMGLAKEMATRALETVRMRDPKLCTYDFDVDEAS